MKSLAVLFAFAGCLIVVGQAQAERTSTQLTPATVKDQPLSFTIKCEQFKDKKKGECLRFHVTAKAKEGNAALAPRRATVLEVFDGEAVVSSCSVQSVEADGELSYSFLVAAKYAEKSTFLFGEVLDTPNGFPAGRYYWFYLKDFVESK